MTHPIVVFGIYPVTVLVTHLTSFMDTLMSSPAAHDGELLLDLLTGYLYFLPIFGDEPIRWRVSHPVKLLLLALTMPVDTFTGVTLMQTRHPMSGLPTAAVHSGGAVRWIGGDFLMLIAMLIVFGLWADEDTRRGASRHGWLEQARVTVFLERTAPGQAAPAAAPDLDNDDEQLAAYNARLARLGQTNHSR